MKRRHLWLVALSLIISVCMCLALAGCNSCGKKATGPVPLDKPEVTLTADGVEWNTVPNASGYAYKVNGGEAVPTMDTSVELNNNDKIVVKAVGDGVNYSDSAWSTEVTFTKTPSPEEPDPLPEPQVTVDPDTGVASWVIDTRADSYVYRINGGAEQTAAGNSVQLEVGQYIEVKAIGDGVNYKSSGWSEKAYYEATEDHPATVDAPTVTVEIDGTVKLFSANALGFKVKINGGEEEPVTEAINDGEVVLATKLTDGQSISAKALGNGTTYLDNENWSDAITYRAPGSDLLAPENIVIDVEGTEAGKVVVSWAEVTGAGGYRYVVGNGDPVDVEGVTVTISLAEGQKVKVMAVGTSTTVTPGDYSACVGDSGYAESEAFEIDNSKTYSVAEMVPVINYYGTTAATKNFTVTGVVVSNVEYSTQYGNIDIVIADEDDDSVTIKLFRAKFATGVGSTSVKENELVGFTVVCEGKPVVFVDNNSNTTLEFDAGCVVKELVANESGMSNAERVAYALLQLSLPNPEISDTNYMFELPAEGEVGTAITWTFEGFENSTDTYEGNVLTLLRRAADSNFTLTATISYGEGNDKAEQTKSFPIVIFSNNGFTTHAQYLAATSGTVKVKGVITGIAGTNIYFEDSDGGYYVYQPTALLGELEVGRTIIAKGTISVYYKLVEITGATVHVLDKELNPVAPTDVTETFKAASAMSDKALLDLQSSLVTIKGATLVKESNKYYLSIGNNKVELYFAGGGQVLGTSALDAIKAEFDANVNKKADVTGYVGVYNVFQLIPAENCLVIDQNSKLELPLPVVNVDKNTGIASWDKNPNASGYVYQIKASGSDWGENKTDATEANGVYTVQLNDGESIRVKALGGDTYYDTDWSVEKTYVAKKPVENGIEFDFSFIDSAKTNDWSTTDATTTFNTACKSAADFVGVTAVSKVYPGDGTNLGLIKFSSGSANGSITLTFNKLVSRVVINAVAWKSANGTYDSSSISVNGVTEAAPTEAADLTFEIAVDKTVTISSPGTTSSNRRFNVFSIIVYFADLSVGKPELDIDLDGVARWEPVENATRYAYTLNDEPTVYYVETTDELKVELKDGDKITLWAVGGGDYKDSDPVEETYVMVPVDLEMSEVTISPSGEARWVAVENAEKYVYQIKEKDSEVWGEEQETTAHHVDLTDGQSIRVKAVGKEGSRFQESDFVEAGPYVKPVTSEQITDLEVSVAIDGTVTITSECADSFNYTIADGTQQSATNTEDHVVVLEKALKNGQTIKVTAIGDGDVYTDSEEVIVTYKAPVQAAAINAQSITVEKDSANEGKALVKWTAVAGATYTVLVNGSVVNAEVSEAQISLNLDTSFVKIEIVVNGNGVTTPKADDAADYSDCTLDSDPVEATDAYLAYFAGVKVATEKAGFEALPEKVTAEKTYYLSQLKLGTYSDVVINWSIPAGDEDYAMIAGDELLITPEKTSHEVTVVVTFSCLEAQETATFVIVVKLAATPTATFNFSEIYSNLTGNDSQTLDGEQIKEAEVTLVFAKRSGGSNATAYYANGAAVRWYGGGTLTVSAEVTITKIEITFTQHDNSISANKITYTDITTKTGIGIWTGSATEIIFTQSGTSGQDRISEIAVTYEEPDYSPEERVAKAEAAFDFTPAPSPESDEDYYMYEFPVDGAYDTTITWEFETLGSGDDYGDGTLLVERTDEERTIIAKATFHYETAQSAQAIPFELTISPVRGEDDNSPVPVSLDFVKNFGTYASSWGNSYSAQTVTFAPSGANITSTVISGSVDFTAACKQGTTISTMPVIANNKKNTAQYVTLSITSGSITSVEFSLIQWGSDKIGEYHIEYSTDNSAWTTCSASVSNGFSATLASNVTLPANVKYIRLSYTSNSTSSNLRMGLSAIDLEVIPAA